ncbi:MAG: hypothetical protein HOA17_08165 [Candidatus Melainabacteria bacterium]|jgi:hypothetical protein|nr:hypothetical protein [Candidatus Melainabacteria bacterium]
MNEILTHSINIAGFCLYVAAIIATVTLPIWGYKLVESKILGKHKALRVANENRSTSFKTTSIVASIGTTTAGVFLIQVLPLVFSMINDVGGQFAVDTVYAEHLTGSGLGDYVNGFYGLTAELGGMMQTAAPMAAVGLGGYNLLNNLSRGLPAIKNS